MKCNRWTLALAAAGLVSLPSLALADEGKPESVMTALSATTISGYVDTSAEWNWGSGNANPPPFAFNGGKQDGFNLNVVKLTIAKDADQADVWGAGYKVDLLFGPDANAFATQSSGVGGDFAVKQAYVDLHAPVLNGLEAKIGVWDTIIGYEVFESGNNPNFTRSYGYTMEPTTHTGLLLSYVVNEMIAVNAGIANTFGPTINARAFPAKSESYKTYMGSVVLTAPKDLGFLAGSTLSAGVINGFNANNGEGVAAVQTSVYAGATVNTPLQALKLGASVDYLKHHNSVDDEGDGTTWATALYASFQATEKLTLNGRAEFVDSKGDLFEGAAATENEGLANNHIWAFTTTAQYDLWKNVISRLEFRWDHVEHSRAFGGTTVGTPTKADNFMLLANVIYKF